MRASLPRPRDPWARLLVDAIQGSQREAFTSSLVSQRWFGAKGRRIVRVRLLDYALLPKVPMTTVLLLVGVNFREGPTEIYALPLAIVPQAGATLSSGQDPAPVILVLRDRRRKAEVRDATGDLAVGRALVEGIRDEAEWTSVVGSFTGRHTMAGRPLLSEPVQQATRFSGEQSNTSLIYDRRLILKVIRKLAHGVNPDFEVLEFLVSRTSYRHVPLLVGRIQYDGALGGKRDGRFSATAAVLQTFVPNEGDAWHYALKQLGALLEGARDPGVMRTDEAAAAFVRMHAAGFLDDMRRLGEITGELHEALSLDSSLPAFRPEPVTLQDVGAWRTGMASQIRGVMRELRQLPGNRLRGFGLTRRAVTGLERACAARLADLSMLLAAPVQKIRHHGDYHLGQVLKTDRDFVILDFEGEPARPLAERREKACALKDVAGMLRSFDYAASTVARRSPSAGQPTRVVTTAWARAASESFLGGYLAAAVPGKVGFLPPTRELLERILWVYLLDKAIYELRYELHNRVDWLSVPLDGLRRLLNREG